MMRFDEDGMCCESCMGYRECGKWTAEIKRYCDKKNARAYANKSECEAILKYWDDKEGSIEEWRRNDIPMKKRHEQGIGCESCFGWIFCSKWKKELNIGACGLGYKAYANKPQTEALLKWHNDRYGSIEQARRDSEKDHSKGGYRQRPHGVPESKPFATLEEFDVTIIRFFIESNKNKFFDLCLTAGISLRDAVRIIKGIK